MKTLETPRKEDKNDGRERKERNWVWDLVFGILGLIWWVCGFLGFWAQRNGKGRWQGMDYTAKRQEGREEQRKGGEGREREGRRRKGEEEIIKRPQNANRCGIQQPPKRNTKKIFQIACAHLSCKNLGGFKNGEQKRWKGTEGKGLGLGFGFLGF